MIQILLCKIQNPPLDFPDSLRIVIIFSKLQRNIQCIQINTFIFLYGICPDETRKKEGVNEESNNSQNTL